MALSLLGLTFFLFLVATNTQSGWVYVIVACLTATLLLGYIIARLMLYKLTVARKFAPSIHSGDDTQVTVTLSNASGSPKFGISIIEQFPSTLPGIAPQRRFYAGYIPAHGSAEFTYTLTCRQRGCHHFTSIILESGFPLSLFYIKKQFQRSDWLCAAPQLTDGDSAHLSTYTSPYNIRSLMRRGQSDSFYGLREYVYGDDLRFVHWRASAHHQELLIKEFQDISSQKRMIIAIDPTRHEFLQTPQQEDLENALSLAGTLAEWCARLKVPCTLVTLSQGGIITAEAQDREKFLAAIQAEPPYTDGGDLGQWLTRERENSDNCQIVQFSIPGTAQGSVYSRSFGQDDILRIICAPPLQKPSLYLAFSNSNGKRMRHYLPLRNRYVPKEARRLANNWNPLLTESYCCGSTLFLCGGISLNDALLWIIRSLR